MEKKKAIRSQGTGYLCIALTLLCLIAPNTHALPKQAEEYAVKAAFLYNALKYTVFPNSPERPIVCTFEDPKVTTSLLRIFDKFSSDRKVTLKELKSLSSIERCQVLFVASSMQERAIDYLKAAQVLPILTIGETDGFCRKGGIMEFVEVEKKLRFILNLKQANKVGLKIDAKMVRVAQEVITE